MGTFSKTLPSSPYPQTYTGFPPDMDDWSCAQWKSYYLANKAIAGKAKALDIVNVDSENVGILATVYACQYDCDWVAFFKSEGLVGHNIFSDIYCGAYSVANSAIDTVANTAGVAANVTGAAKSFSASKVLLIGGIALGLFAAYKFSQSDAAKNLKFAL